ncbi:alkaline phosphatase family protein, partial [Patescibacteria group bacterium]|nr:alkaline phosphatase family protein [Patescibacteria group bacterium]
DQFKREVIVDDIFFVGLTNFGDDLPMSVAFPEFPILKTLPEILSNYNLKQLYLAEEEKYAHVTYFFHGGTTIDFPGEKKIMVDSMDVKDYATCPEMSSREVLDVFLKHIKEGKDNFILVNFPNPDMLAHTGDLKAAIKTMECLDGCLEKMVDAVHEQHGTMLITADHGGIEEMLDPETGEAVTKHSTNPVPFIIVNDVKEKTLVDGVLADVAPTILDIMGIPKPEEMTGKSLIIKEKKQK